MNTITRTAIAVAATALIVAPVTAYAVASLTPERVVTVTHTVPQVVGISHTTPTACEDAAQEFMAVATDLLVVAHHNAPAYDAWLTDNLGNITDRHNAGMELLVECQR